MNKLNNMNKIELNKSRHSRLALTLSAILSITFIVLILLAIYGVISFFDHYGLQSPIILRSAIYNKQKDILITPVATHGAKTSQVLDLGKIADKIYQLESSGGRNDGCRKLGLYNGYGYSQSTFEWKCYTSHEEVRTLVINWLENHIGKYGLEKSLCIYNRGVNEEGCTYAVAYNSL